MDLRERQRLLEEVHSRSESASAKGDTAKAEALQAKAGAMRNGIAHRRGMTPENANLVEELIAIEPTDLWSA